jgi:hypothetical protein
MEESLNQIGIQHAVVDVAVTIDSERPLVIELNPWGMRAGPALFDWNEDAKILLGIDQTEVSLKLVEQVGSFGAERIPVNPLCKCDF